MEKELKDYMVSLLDRAKYHYRLWNTEKTIDIHEAMKIMEKLVIRISDLESSLSDAGDIFIDRGEPEIGGAYKKIADSSYYDY